MPPLLAFLLCGGAVGYLLRLERKQLPGVSTAVWIPTLWLLVAASRPLGRWFTGEEAESGGALNEIVFGVLLVLNAVVLKKRRCDLAAILKQSRWLMAVALYMLLSVVWSEEPFTAFKRWIREFQVILVGLLICTDPDPRKAVKSVLMRTVYVLIPSSVVLIKYFPAYGVAYGRWSGGIMWLGVAMQKNGLGRLCLIAIFFLAWFLITQRSEAGVPHVRHATAANVFVLLIAIWLLRGPTVQAYSATAVVSLLGGFLTYAGLYWVQKLGISFLRTAVIPLLIVILVGGTVLPLVTGDASGEESPAQRGTVGTLGRDETFTGRTGIWGGLIPDVERNPVLGVGLLSFWTPERVLVHDIGEAHNGYLDMLLQLGAVGLILVCYYVISICRRALDILDRDFNWGCLVACFAVMFGLHNMSESSIHCFTSTLGGLFALLAITFPVISFGPRKAAHPRRNTVEVAACSNV